MYDEILDSLEISFKVAYDMNENHDKLNKIADLIIKIKTIQYMDVQAELIQASRRVSRN